MGRHNAEAKKPAFLYDERTKAIAKKYNKTPAQVAIRFCVSIYREKSHKGLNIITNTSFNFQLDLGTIPIPKSVTNSRIEENFQVFDFQLTPEDMKVLEDLNAGIRVCYFSMIDKSHKYYPFKAEF